MSLVNLLVIIPLFERFIYLYIEDFKNFYIKSKCI